MEKSGFHVQQGGALRAESKRISAVDFWVTTATQKIQTNNPVPTHHCCRFVLPSKLSVSSVCIRY